MADSRFIKNQNINFLFMSQIVCTSRKLLIVLYLSYIGQLIACSGTISACGLDISRKLNMYRLVKTCLEKTQGKTQCCRIWYRGFNR